MFFGGHATSTWYGACGYYCAGMQKQGDASTLE
jgi:hypothetical protein